MAKSSKGDPWEYSLRKYLLLLATLVATVTYSAGFNPPGGVWQDADTDVGHLAGDPIIRDTSYIRYLAFYYCNASAFASSLVVIVLVLILSIHHDRGTGFTHPAPAPLHTLRVVMVMDLLSLMGAYAAGTFRDVLTAVYSLLLVAGVVVYVAVNVALASWDTEAQETSSSTEKKDEAEMERPRKVLMLLATFAVSVTYLGGMSAPGGFWDHTTPGGPRAGHAVLKGGRHDRRLKAFFICNTTAFVASLLIIVLLLDKKLRRTDKVRSAELYGFILVALSGLIGAYSAGSCREVDTTVYVNALIGAVLITILILVVVVKCGKRIWGQQPGDPQNSNGCPCFSFNFVCDEQQQQGTQALEKARSLVLLLATLAAAITYQAGLDPPGGLWEEDGEGHLAGDPILLTRNPRRFKAFYYCNSVAFVASLVAIILVRLKTLHRHNALEAAMILDLFGLIGAYAAGSCRDVQTSIYAMALAGVVLVYVVLHVVFFTLDHEDDTRASDAAFLTKQKEQNELVEKRRKRLLLFAILAATITYQAGLTPPSGFRLQDDASGHRAGDPVLLYNSERRYKAFFYCNSVSFMLSIALIILLVNKNLYRPAIRSNALSVCTAAGMFGLVGAYAAGSTQHFKTSIYIFVLAGLVLAFVAALVLVFRKGQQGANAPNNSTTSVPPNAGIERAVDGAEQSSAPEGNTSQQADPENGTNAAARTAANAKEEKATHSKRKYLMLLGILVASITYQAGLDPPGGVWQGDGAGHAAGNPIMHDNRRPRYLAFFYSNSASFVASVVVIILLLPEKLHEKKWWFTVMNTTVRLDLLGLLVAYAAGSSRSWKTSGYVSALVIAVLGYFVIHLLLSFFSRFCKTGSTSVSDSVRPNGDGVEPPAQRVGA